MNFVAAIQSLVESKRRSFLSALGVMVGSVAIILLLSIGIGVEKDVRQQVEELGVNVLVVIPGKFSPGTINPNIGGQSFLDESDAKRLAVVPGVRSTALLTFAGGGLRWGKKEAFPMVIATEASWFAMHRSEMAEGANFSADQQLEPVCVLGGIAKEDLFGSEPALGKEVTIGGGKYRVVGVTKGSKSGESLFAIGSFQNVAYVPMAQWRNAHKNVQIDRIMVQSSPDAEPKALVKRLEKVMAERLDDQAFSVLTQEDLLGLVFRVISIVGWLLVGLTSIALFVGSLGIMAVMTMSVNERRKEIGIRKTVGAKRSDIFKQFLSEAVLIGLLGVVASIVVSVLGCLALAAWTPIKPIITPGTLGLALGVGVGLGGFFGVLPAIQAARQDPVVALRSE